MILLYAALFGFIGGITRACVGILKNKAYKKRKFKLRYFLWTVILSGVIGVFCGLFFPQYYKFSLLAGYAGTDFIQGIYKTLKKD